MQIHYHISTSMFDNCTTMCEFCSSSGQISWNPYKWERRRRSFTTHNYPGWMATHTRNNNLVHFLWIYINLLNNRCSQEENQSVFVCHGPAHLPGISQLHSRGRNTYELVWNSRYDVQSRMNVVLYRTKSYKCHSNVVAIRADLWRVQLVVYRRISPVMSWQFDRGFSEYRFDLLSLPNFSISSVERTVHKICVLFCRKVAEKNNNIEMLVKTVYRTVLSHLWTEIFSKIAFFSAEK